MADPGIWKEGGGGGGGGVTEGHFLALPRPLIRMVTISTSFGFDSHINTDTKKDV